MTDPHGTKHTHLERYREKARYVNSLQRKLERQGSVYGRVSLVTQTFNDIQQRNFKQGVSK